MTNRNDEIDIKQVIKISINFLKKHKKLLSIFLFLAIIGGFFKYFHTKPYYETEMVITSGLVYEKSNQLYKTNLQPILSVLNILKKNINKKNYKFTKNSLNISNPKSIKEIEVEVYKDKNLTTVEPENILIKIKIYDKSLLKKVQKSIVNYCNQNDYVKLEFEKQLKYRKKSKKIIENELKLLDSLKPVLTKNTYNNNNFAIVDFGNLSNLIELQLQKQKLSSSVIENPVIVVHRFSEFPQKISKKIIKSLTFFVFIIIIGFITAFILEIIKISKNA